MNSRVAQFLQGDKVIWTIVLILATLSVMAVYSSTGMLAYKEKGGLTEFYLLKHGSFIMGGLILTWVFSRLPYVFYGRVAKTLFYLTIPLLIYTLFFGVDMNDARRWITIPIISLTFQASDFAKVVLMLFLARQLALHQGQKMDLFTLAKPVLLPVAIVCALIMPANLSTALLLFLTSMALMVVGRIDLRSLGAMIGAGVLLFGVIFLLGLVMPEATRASTWVSRIQSFATDSDGGYQVQQAKIAIVNGGLFGEGPGNSYQRNVLPSGYSDFIYAIFIEEYGFIGAVFLLIMYVLFFIRSVRLVTLCDKPFGSLLVMGISLLIVLQALANMAVAVNLGPVTGVTLPFMSMGGTSLLFFSMSAGMILSVSRYVERTQSEEVKEMEPCVS
ncbi:MAG: FtsW/RodA/SpoVE family cell cycle protein [Saprospiraceae bacterium]|jgi:cell division protein FtsW|nr:FtsW/RodA/SpoVE family cell cycle protein [Saprospiraceae bacterium]